MRTCRVLIHTRQEDGACHAIDASHPTALLGGPWLQRSQSLRRLGGNHWRPGWLQARLEPAHAGKLCNQHLRRPTCFQSNRFPCAPKPEGSVASANSKEEGAPQRSKAASEECQAPELVRSRGGRQPSGQASPHHENNTAARAKRFH